MQGKAKNVIAVAIITVGVLLLWWKVTLGGLTPTVIDSEHLYENFLSVIPALHRNIEIVKQGQLPLWSPYGQTGMVLFADPQFTAAYPMTWIGLFLSTGATFRTIIVAHILIAALPIYFLMRRLGTSASAALVAAFVYACSLPVVYGFMLPSRWSWYWAPLLVLLAAICLDSEKRSAVALLALAWGILMTTIIQGAYNIGLFLCSFAACYTLVRSATVKSAAAKLTLFGTALVLGTGLAAMYLFPLWEFKGQWAYREFAYEAATVGSFPPQFILEAFLAGRPGHSPINWTLMYSMGIAGTTLALYGLVLSFRRKAVLFFGAALGISLCLSVGSHTPLYRIFHGFAPGAASFHAPLRMLYGIPLCMAVLAGYGADYLFRTERQSSGKLPALVLLAVLCAAWGVLSAGSRGPFGVRYLQLSPSASRDLVIPAIAVLGLVGGYLASFVRRRWLVAGLLLAAGFESWRGMSSLVYFDFEKKYETPPAVEFLESRGGVGRFFSYNRNLDRYASWFTEQDSVPMVYPELANYFGVYDIQARGPLRIDCYDKLIKAINRKYEVIREVGFYMAEVRDYASRLIDLFGVTHIVSKGPLRPREILVYEAEGEVTLEPDKPFRMRLDNQFRTDELVIVSYLEGARSAAQGTAVARLTLLRGGRNVGEYDIRAGIHTAEVFDLNAPGTKSLVAHGKAAEGESWDEVSPQGEKLTGTRYRGTVKLGGEKVFDGIELRYLHPQGVMRWMKIGCMPEDSRTATDRFVPVFTDARHGIIIYENTRAMPRAFLVHSAYEAKSREDALERTVDGSIDLRRCVVLEGESPPHLSDPSLQTTEGDDVRFLEYSPNRIRISISARAPAILFLSDIYYPGWESFIDGERAVTCRADYAFRAVAVPAGRHEVTMVFRPRSLRIGALLSLASLLGLVLILVVRGRGMVSVS
jgi:hypothetical protein